MTALTQTRITIIGHAGEVVGYADSTGDGMWHAHYWQEAREALVDGGEWQRIEDAKANVLRLCGPRMARCLSGCHMVPTSPDLPGFGAGVAWDYYDCGDRRDVSSGWD